MAERVHPLLDPAVDHLEINVHYALINDGADFVFDKVRWQWRGRCSKNGTARDMQHAENDAITALNEWSRGG